MRQWGGKQQSFLVKEEGLLSTQRLLALGVVVSLGSQKQLTTLMRQARYPDVSFSVWVEKGKSTPETGWGLLTLLIEGADGRWRLQVTGGLPWLFCLLPDVPWLAQAL